MCAAGCAGLQPTVAAIKAGKDICLANKETLIAGGPYVLPLAREHGVNILPADSEHSVSLCAPFSSYLSRPETHDISWITTRGVCMSMGSWGRVIHIIVPDSVNESKGVGPLCPSTGLLSKDVAVCFGFGSGQDHYNRNPHVPLLHPDAIMSSLSFPDKCRY